MLGKKILKFVAKKNISMRQFSIAVNIDHGQISRYVHGKAAPTERTHKKILAVYPDFDEVSTDEDTNIEIKIRAYEEAIKAQEGLIETQRETIEILRTSNRSLKEQVADLKKKLTRH